MSENDGKICIDERVQRFYQLGKNYDEVDPEELNPSLYSLKKVSQRYQSPELIAEGGMKRIYKVYDARAKRYLAMAMLHGEAPEELCDPFIHEAWLTALLAHPNIITIHDIGVNAAGRPYFTMDLKEGESLRELIEKLHNGDREALKKYPLEPLLQIFIKICDAVSYAHSLSVLHLDLKPANIQIGEFGQVLVCDWGMGKILGSENNEIELDRQLLNPDLLSSVTLYGDLKGTPGNMAPEQVQNEDELDIRTDVYGLGTILYSLLTFRRPLSGDTEEILQHTVNGAIVPPAKRAPEREVPRALDAVVMKALALQPSKRYSSVAELRTEVHRFLTGYATEAEQAGVGKQFMLFYGRNRMFCNMFLASVFILLGGGIWSYVKLDQKEKTASEARHRAEENLALYLAGQNELEKVSLKNVDSLARLARRHFKGGEKGYSLAVLEAGLRENPDHPVLLRELGWTYFVDQKFSEASRLFAQGIWSNDVVSQAASRYAGLKPDDNKILTVSEMVELLQMLEGHDPLRLIVVQMDQRRRFDLVERAAIIEACLHLVNPDWTDGWFEYDTERRRLRVGGEGLDNLFTNPNILVGLDLKELDISGSDVAELTNIDQLPFERLDIRNTLINAIWPLKRHPYVRELRVDQGQIPDDQLKQIAARVQVVY